MANDWTSTGGREVRFPLTRWTLIGQAQGSAEAERRQALEALTRAYWKPLYCFLRAGGMGNETAKDLVQGFFARLLADAAVMRFDPGRGHFRSFLLGCLKRYTAAERLRAEAGKRGGGAPILSLDDSGDARFTQLAGAEVSPEEAYDRCWALETLARAVAAVRAELIAQGRREEAAVLDGFVAADDPARPGYAELRKRSGMSENGVRHALERIKALLERALADELTPETGGAAAAEEERAALLASLARCVRRR